MLALLVHCQPAFAQAQSAPPKCRYTNFATLPVNTKGAVVTLEGSINRSAATMLVDTGAQGTSVTRAVVDKLGLKPIHSDTTTFGTGGESAFYTTRVDDFSFGPLHWQRATLGVVWDIGQEDGFSGLMGADVLFRQDVEFFLAKGVLRFFEPQSCNDTYLAYWDENAGEVPLSEMAPDDLRQVVTVEINGKPVRALIDSGASMSVIEHEALERLGIAPLSQEGGEPGIAVGVGSHKVQYRSAQFESFRLGGEEIKYPTISIMDSFGAIRSDSGMAATASMLNEEPDMLLGADFLRAHRLLFAVSQRRLYFSYLGGRVFGKAGAPAQSKAQSVP